MYDYHIPRYHHNESALDYVKQQMMQHCSYHYAPERTFRQRLQFQLYAPQYQGHEQTWGRAAQRLAPKHKPVEFTR